MRPLEFAPLQCKSAEPPWLAAARALIGLAETPGPGSNAQIIAWARALKLPYADDDTSWCGLFIAHVIRTTLPGEPLPASPLAARQWRQFGIACPPQPGAVMSFWRGRREGWQGHVGLYVGEDDGAFHILGGNQGNRVSITRIARARLLAARWPATAPPPTGGPVRVTASGALSGNEA